jgi:hypothetical protein
MSIIRDITRNIGDLNDLNEGFDDLVGTQVFNGRTNQQSDARHRRRVSTDDVRTARNTTRIMQEEERQVAIAGGDMDSRFNPVYVDAVENRGSGIINRGNYGDYTPRVPANRRAQSDEYMQAYRQQYPQQYSRPTYNPIDGILTGPETSTGLRNGGLTGNITELKEFAAEIEALTGRKVTYVEGGEMKLSMVNLGSALTDYVHNNPQIDMAALEAGDPSAWQALQAFVKSDAARLGLSNGRDGVIQTPPTGDITLNPATRSYDADQAVITRMGELLKDVPLEQRQQMSAQATAALRALGVKVEGSPIEELSGWIAKERPDLAEKIRKGNLADAAAALRQATGELETEANRELDLARVRTRTAQSAQNPNAAQQPQTVLTEAELLRSLESAEMVGKVSDIKQHLNKLTGSNFSNDDNVREPGFLQALTQTLNRNLDQQTLRDLERGGAFVVEGTFQKVEENMRNRGNVEQQRERFEAGFNEGATTQITRALLNEGGQEAHVQMQQNLRALGYDSTQGLTGSLRDYLSDKLYNQGNFRTAPPEVQQFLKDVESGQYNDSFPLANQENSRQMDRVLEYVQNNINLDLAKKEQGLPVGRDANVNPSPNDVAVPNAQNPNAVPSQNANDQSQETSYDSTVRTYLTTQEQTNLARLRQEQAVQNEHERDIRNMAMAIRQRGYEDPFVIANQELLNKERPAIEAQIAEQNRMNTIRLDLAATEQRTTATQVQQVSNVQPQAVTPAVPVAPVAIVSENPPAVTAPQTQPVTPQTPTTPTNDPAAQVAKIESNLEKFLPSIPADKLAEIKEKLPDFFKKNGIIPSGDIEKDLARYIQANEPKIAAELSKDNPNLELITNDLRDLLKKIESIPTQSQTTPAPATVAPTTVEPSPIQQLTQPVVASANVTTPTQDRTVVVGGTQVSLSGIDNLDQIARYGQESSGLTAVNVLQSPTQPSRNNDIIASR